MTWKDFLRFWRSVPSRGRMAAQLIALGVLLATIALLLVPDRKPFIGDRGALDFLGTIAAFAVAIFSVFLLNKRTINSEKLLEHTQLAEQAGRYQKGAELLANERLAPRLAGILILRNIAIANPRQYYYAVLNVLITFAEEQTADVWQAYERLKKPNGGVAPAYKNPDDLAKVRQKTPEDVVAAIRAVGSIRGIHDRKRYEASWVGDAKLRIHRVILSDCTVRGGNFDLMHISEGLFDGVRFAGCSFKGTEIGLMDVIDISFRECDLEDADLTTVDNVKIDEVRRIGLTDSRLRNFTVRALAERVIVEDSEVDEKTEIFASELLFEGWSHLKQPRILAHKARGVAWKLHDQVPPASLEKRLWVDIILPKEPKGLATTIPQKLI